MRGTLLLTGATGAIGVPLLAALLGARSFRSVIALTRTEPDRLRTALARETPGLDVSPLTVASVDLAADSVTPALAALPSDIDCIVHAAACTKFRGSLAELARVNVDATQRVLTWAATLPRRPRIVHFSTTCVAGRRTGEIAEAPLRADCGFVNDYERTKWQAEQLVTASTLQPELIRLATVIGSARDGHLARPGAFHTTLRWLHGGLLPMVPGDETTRLDLLPTELVTDFILRLLDGPENPGRIYHLSSGARGIPLGELLDFAAQRFGSRSAAWRSAQILPPVLASRAAFEDFRATIVKSRDFLFNQVLESVDSFLPELFYPKRYATVHAETAWGGALPLPEWRDWLGRVIDYALDSDFGRKEVRPAPA